MTTDQAAALPVLSVRQPWASFLISGLKRLELRTWDTPYRGWLWLHAGKQVDREALEIYGLGASAFKTGGLVGVALLTNCLPIESPAAFHALRNDHRSPGDFQRSLRGWEFSDVIPLPELIAVPGELKLFTLSSDRQALVRESLAAPAFQEFVESLLALPS